VPEPPARASDFGAKTRLKQELGEPGGKPGCNSHDDRQLPDALTARASDSLT
jgi:hypothetical protein